MDINTEMFIGKKRSMLGMRMYDEINKLYEIRDGVRARYPNLDVKEERSRVYKAVIRSGWGNDLLKIIEEETNVRIGSIALFDAMAGYYAIGYEPKYALINYANSPMLTRKTFDLLNPEHTTTAINKFFDAMDSVKSQNKVAPEYTQLISYPKLYFDVSMALMFDKIKLDSGIDVGLTCAEVTAIILHEVGHAVTISQTLGYTRTILSDFHAIKAPTLRTKEEAYQLNNTIKQLYADVKKHGKTNKEMDAYVKKATNRVQDILDKDVVPDGFAKRFMYKFISIFLTITIFNGIIASIIVDYAIRVLQYKNNKYKYSDFYVAGKIYNQNEFWADEFATMNGFGPEIVSGLGKIIHVLRGYSLKAKKGSDVYHAVNKNILLAVFMYLGAPLAGRYETHGNDAERYKEIDIRLRKELRRIDGLDKNMEKDLIAEIDRAREAIAYALKLNKKMTDDMMEWGDTIRTVMNSTVKAVLFFSKANMEEPKYAKLMHDMDALTNTSMHYQSKKIAKLA